MQEYEILSNKNRMRKDEFNRIIKKSNLTKKKFANIVGLGPRSVNNWGTINQRIPVWVRSWLINYKLALKIEKLKILFVEEFLEIIDEEALTIMKDEEIVLVQKDYEKLDKVINKETFNKKLKKLNLQKKKFSQMVGLEPKSVNNWGSKDKKIPSWVNSWLEFYEIGLKVKTLKKILFDDLLNIIDSDSHKRINDGKLKMALFGTTKVGNPHP